MSVHQLSRADARRIAVRAQLLDKNRPTGLVDVVRGLTLLQVDPTAAIAPSADLVAWSRLGSTYSPDDLTAALGNVAASGTTAASGTGASGTAGTLGTGRAVRGKRELIELRGMIRPAEDIALFRADMADWPGRGELRDWQVYRRDWVSTNIGCRLDILDRLDSSGPLTSRDLPDTCEKAWASSGWTNDRNVTQLLEFMVSRGEVAVAGRKGRERLWDLAERVYPDVPAVPADEAVRIRDERRLRALGIARAKAPECPGEPVHVGEAGEPAVIDGVRGTWRVDPALLGPNTPGRAFSGRAALLSPFDRLVQDRKRLDEIFEYDYQLEMYKPALKRRWGYFALPILYGDRLVGKLDAVADRKAGVLKVNAIHRELPFTRPMTAAVRREITDLATWLTLDLAMSPTA